MILSTHAFVELHHNRNKVLYTSHIAHKTFLSIKSSNLNWNDGKTDTVVSLIYALAAYQPVETGFILILDISFFQVEKNSSSESNRCVARVGNDMFAKLGGKANKTIRQA